MGREPHHLQNGNTDWKVEVHDDDEHDEEDIGRVLDLEVEEDVDEGDYAEAAQVHDDGYGLKTLLESNPNRIKHPPAQHPSKGVGGHVSDVENQPVLPRKGHTIQNDSEGISPSPGNKKTAKSRK